jgi:hypothetical protein
VSYLRLRVDVTVAASSNELLDYVRMPFNCSDVKRFRRPKKLSLLGSRCNRLER